MTGLAQVVAAVATWLVAFRITIVITVITTDTDTVATTDIIRKFSF